MIINNGRYLRRGEVWFDEQPNQQPDIIVYKQAKNPILGATCSDFYTLLIDLKNDSESIFSGFKKGTKYEIKRAETKDSLSYSYFSIDKSKSVIDRFSDHYDQFAATKNLSLMNRDYLYKLAEQGLLDISHVSTVDGDEITWHAYFRKENRVRLLYSASLFRIGNDSAMRSLIGRANRFHHWVDILRFKSESIDVYDFGGWYAGEGDPQKEKINNFKAEFGGLVVKEFNCIQLASRKAKLLFYLKSLFDSRLADDRSTRCEAL